MTANKYAMMFRKWKDIFNKDMRTSQLEIYGGEYSRKKTLPAILIFPESKTWLDDPNTRNYRKTSLPKPVKYDFNIWAYVSLTELEDSYYNEMDGVKAGLTQVLTEIEEVLKDNHTGFDLMDTTLSLWSDIMWEAAEISQRPGKLMSGRIRISLITKEIA